MQCGPRRGWAGPAIRSGLVTLALIAWLAAPAAPAGDTAATVASPPPADAAHPAAPPFAPAFTTLPLAPPLGLNGGFGEYRSNHFHAGLDLSTQAEVGHPVLAPLDGWIERARASGVGYGRSLYLHGADGRLLVFGHLDAYAEPLASYLAAIQDSTGQYEQDLWFDPARFPVKAGQRIAWSGESGAGGPHLHVEVRRGDMAYDPLRAGFVIADTSAPIVPSVTLEPLDDSSFVERSAAPVTIRLGTQPATVTMLGRARVIVAARDGIWRGVDRMVPWSVGIAFDRWQIECRFDSVSWATDMSESDYIYDTGAVTGERGMMMWAPAGFRPRIMRTSAAIHEEAGTLVVRPGDPPRTLKIVARDVAGNLCERALSVVPPAGDGGPDPAAGGGRVRPDLAHPVELSSLPGHRLRITYRAARRASRHVTIAGHAATCRDGDWTAVVTLPRAGGRDAASLAIAIEGEDASGQHWSADPVSVSLVEPGEAPAARPGPIAWAIPAGGQFQLAPVLFAWSDREPGAPGELTPRSPVLELMPGSVRLRKPMRLEWNPGQPANVGLYADDGDGWGWVGSPYDSLSRKRVGETRHFGRFALFADSVAPRITPLKARPRAAAGPYNRWALEARVHEGGSGVEARGSWVEVDGRRMPAEWDSEKEILRWRPLKAPRAGVHRFTFVARDRAGNERRASGRFTLR